MQQFATAQVFPLRAETVNTAVQQRLSRIGDSRAGERIVSVTCDPFMSTSQEQVLMRLLLEQDDEPWINLSLKNHLAIQNLLEQLDSFGIASLPVDNLLKKPVQKSQLKRWQADRLDSSKF